MRVYSNLQSPVSRLAFEAASLTVLEETAVTVVFTTSDLQDYHQNQLSIDQAIAARKVCISELHTTICNSYQTGHLSVTPNQLAPQLVHH